MQRQRTLWKVCLTEFRKRTTHKAKQLTSGDSAGLVGCSFYVAQTRTTLDRGGEHGSPCQTLPPAGSMQKKKGLLKNEQTQLQNHSFLKNSAQIARKTAF
nr:MAG TPA: hypothetical protein [Caudoviricetes sp.]